MAESILSHLNPIASLKTYCVTSPQYIQLLIVFASICDGQQQLGVSL